LAESRDFAIFATLVVSVKFSKAHPSKISPHTRRAGCNGRREFAASYRDLLDHYGLQGHRINVRKPHENGDVESSHGHFKDALDQALRLRESRDFDSVDNFLTFVRQLTTRRNASREKAFREEAATLNPLPRRRRSTCTSVPVTVRSDSIIRVKRNVYSVSSKYVGLKLEVRVHQDHLELWYQNQCLERMPRQFGQGKEAIDFRHVIDSLVRKPGAFVNYKVHPTEAYLEPEDHYCPVISRIATTG